MEFPHLGRHCDHASCRQLDFLPLKCDACKKIFCKDHFFYSRHDCPEDYRKNVQVPLCPICNRPIPVGRNELPDVEVGKHIDRGCWSAPSQGKKIFSNECSRRGCKQKELVPFRCDACGKNHCLRHRHREDHDCAGQKKIAPTKSTPNRSSEPTPNFAEVQGTMDDDEAFARALQLSLNDAPGGDSKEWHAAAARAHSTRHGEQRDRREKSCHVS